MKPITSGFCADGRAAKTERGRARGAAQQRATADPEPVDHDCPSSVATVGLRRGQQAVCQRFGRQMPRIWAIPSARRRQRVCNPASCMLFGRWHPFCMQVASDADRHPDPCSDPGRKARHRDRRRHPERHAPARPQARRDQPGPAARRVAHAGARGTAPAHHLGPDRHAAAQGRRRLEGDARRGREPVRRHGRDGGDLRAAVPP